MSIEHDDKEPKMNDQDILDYLKDNPDFITRHLDIFEAATMPSTAHDNGVADFQSYMIKRLKSDKAEVLEATRTIVETSRANMNNQARIHKAVLRLLESNNFDDFIQSITMDLASLLDLDIATFVVETNGQEIPHVHTTGIRVIPEGTIDSWMHDKDVMMQNNISGIEAIYGGGATLVQSQILMRIDISMDTPPALLAFGSRDPELFKDGQATDQVLFLARVVERCFRQWLRLPI